MANTSQRIAFREDLTISFTCLSPIKCQYIPIASYWWDRSACPALLTNLLCLFLTSSLLCNCFCNRVSNMFKGCCKNFITFIAAVLPYLIFPLLANCSILPPGGGVLCSLSAAACVLSSLACPCSFCWLCCHAIPLQCSCPRKYCLFQLIAKARACKLARGWGQYCTLQHGLVS